MSINTNSTLSLTAQWSEIETDPSSVTNVVSDVGNISYSFTYASGTGPGKIDQTFHINSMMTGTDVDTYDLTNMTGTMFDKDIVSSFSKVKSLSFKHVSGDDTIIDILEAAEQFNEPFGVPDDDIFFGSGSYICVNTTGEGWTVDATNRLIVIGDASPLTSVRYEMLILGEK